MQTQTVEYRERADRSLILLGASLGLLLVSLALPIVSVHTYCENRVGASIFGVLSLTTVLLIVRNHASSRTRKMFAAVGVSTCLFAVAVNVAFIAYATHVCRHMFDQMK